MRLTSKRSAFDSARELPASPTRRLDSLTGMRFLAALLVVVHHLVYNRFQLDTALVKIPEVGKLSGIGYCGVTFFFCLSGFVLTWAWEPGGDTMSFLGRRLARIYPLHLVTWAAAFAVILYVGQHIDWGQAGTSLFLVQSWTTSNTFPFGHNAVAWSLSCELFFYILFPSIIRRLEHLGERALLRVVVGAGLYLAAVPIALYVVAGNKYWVQVAYAFPPYRLGEFVIGIGAALLVRRGWRPFWSLRLAGAAVVCSLVAVAAVDSHVGGSAGVGGLPRSMVDLLVLPAFAVWIVAAAVSDVDGRSGVLARRTLVNLGTWSFALYLTHQMLLRVIAHIFADAGVHLFTKGIVVNVSVAVVVIAFLVAVSAAAFYAIEHPSNIALRRALSPKPRDNRHRPRRR